MQNGKRKTDRRTLYTCKAIQDAVLELLSEKDYYQITVTDICKKAEISRGTFYLHYGNISQIVDELIDAVLRQSTPLSEHLALRDAAGGGCAFPLCRFLRSRRQYQALILSDSLRGRVLQRLAQSGGDGFPAAIAGSGACSRQELSTLRLFQMSGCLAVCKQNIQCSDEDWAKVQCSIDRLLQFGFQSK